MPYNKEEAFYTDKENDLAVVTDGYLYNKVEIAEKLQLEGGKPGISELAARAFLRWGVSFVNQWNGDFTICLYLKKKQEVLLFRDHLGIRPLAISKDREAVYFASDMMGLSRALFNKSKIDKDFLLNMFLLAGHNYSMLPNKNILKLPPGHYCRISPGLMESRPYWFPSEIRTDHTLSFNHVMQELSHLLRDAVNIRADYRFNTAAHVSGGLDSAVTAVLARREYASQATFYGFSWSPETFDESEFTSQEERLLVSQICDQNSIQPVYSGFTLSDYYEFVSDWRHPSELVFEKRVVEAAKNRGVNLIFSGWGGDEFVSLGDRGIDADLIKNMKWITLLKKYNLWKPKCFISALFFNIKIRAERSRYSGYKAEKTVYPYIQNVLGRNNIPLKMRFHHNSRRDVHLQLINLQHLAARASDWYVLGQRNGIEYRYPLLDKRIVEYMLKVPSQCLVSGNMDRIVLRHFGKGLLPDSVLNRTTKEDPAISRHFDSISVEAKKQFANELNIFRKNPQLDFFDFELMERNLPKLMADAINRSDEMGLNVFFYLKRAHEFCDNWHNKEGNQ